MDCVAGRCPTDCACPLSVASRTWRVAKGSDWAWQMLTTDANATTVSKEVLRFRIMMLLCLGNTVSVIEPAVGPDAPVSDFKKRRRSLPARGLERFVALADQNHQRPAIGNGLAEIGKHSTS